MDCTSLHRRKQCCAHFRLDPERSLEDLRVSGGTLGVVGASGGFFLKEAFLGDIEHIRAIWGRYWSALIREGKSGNEKGAVHRILEGHWGLSGAIKYFGGVSWRALYWEPMNCRGLSNHQRYGAIFLMQL